MQGSFSLGEAREGLPGACRLAVLTWGPRAPPTMTEEVCGSEIRAGPPWASLLFVA